MLRALLSGVSGLRNHQLRLDVIGNNIANVNTVGFKASRVTFQEGFAQILSQATSSTLQTGSRNPEQVGSGSQVGSIDTRFTQGALEATGHPLDLAIAGEGFFSFRAGDGEVYSRAGNLQVDANGQLVLGGTGYVLQGVNATSDGSLTGSVGDIVLPLDEGLPAKATSMVEITGNLDGAAEIGETHQLLVSLFDSTGSEYDLNITFTYDGDGSWSWSAGSDQGTVGSPGGGTVNFLEDGTLGSFEIDGGGNAISFTPEGSNELMIDIQLGGTEGSGLSSYAGTTTAAVTSQNGRRAGELSNLGITADGVIQGIYTNGETQNLAQIGITTFANPGGLLRGDGNVFLASASSGIAVPGFSGTTTTSAVLAGALETSNVDISEEFTDMIIAQRGFQANARMVTTADGILAELINLTQ